MGCKCEANMRDDRYILISICKTFRAQERPKTIEVFALFCIYHSYQICKSLKLNIRPLHKKDTCYFVENYFVFFSWFTITIYICCPCAANHWARKTLKIYCSCNCGVPPHLSSPILLIRKDSCQKVEIINKV